MPFDPTIAAIRFGGGLSPHFAKPSSVEAILAELSRKPQFDIPTFKAAKPSLPQLKQATAARREAAGTDQFPASEAAVKAMRQAAAANYDQTMRATIARFLEAPHGFAERLTDFWSDHFTVIARNAAQRHLISAYIEESVRPYIGGSFVDMLGAVMTDSLMLMYLQQIQSTGPESPRGQRLGRGLNENLAGELLELHTLGVDGHYTQADVRALAELLTGLTYNGKQGFFYNIRMAEPGAETVLGVTYDAADGLPNILAAIEDIALHPDTAHHLCLKIATYFMGTAPDAAMVAAMAGRYLETGGQLQPVYEAMFGHVAAWSRDLRQIKSPLRFLTSGLRALGVSGAQMMVIDRRMMRNVVIEPLRVMGQPWQAPLGPDGWPDDGADWVTPQGVAGRINWAMTAPQIMVERELPDPRVFVQTALGDLATQEVIFAASAAESKFEGVGVVLAAPAFQRS